MGLCLDLLFEALQNLLELLLGAVDGHGGIAGGLQNGIGDLRVLPQLGQLVKGFVIGVVGAYGPDVDVGLSLGGVWVVLSDGGLRVNAGALEEGVCLLYTSPSPRDS